MSHVSHTISHAAYDAALMSDNTACTRLALLDGYYLRHRRSWASASDDIADQEKDVRRYCEIMA